MKIGGYLKLLTVLYNVHNRVRVVVDYVDVNCELGKINENNNILRNRLSLFFLNEAFRENNSNVCLLSHRWKNRAGAGADLKRDGSTTLLHKNTHHSTEGENSTV